MSNIEQKVIKYLIRNKLIPAESQFSITETLLKEYIKMYSKYNTGKFQVNLKGKEFWYARKLAGLTFLKINRERGHFSNIKEGLVYIIENPVYPDHLKIGMTIDLNVRLSQYQTYDPLKRFKVKNYEFVLNRRFVEENVIASYGIDLQKSEWIPITNSINIIQNIRNNRWNINTLGR